MKKLTLAVALLVALMLSQTASADSRHHRRGYSYGYSNHYQPNSYHYGYNRRHYRGNHSSYSYGNYYGGHNGHHGSHDNEWGYFVGGAILGSLLTYPRYQAPVRETREIVYVKETAPRRTSSSVGRRLLKDLEGNCFERVRDEEGNEIRVQIEASACNF